MLDGVDIDRKYGRDQHAEVLHLLRTVVTEVENLRKSMSGKKQKASDVLNVWPIPELDPVIKKARELHKKQFEERAEQVLEKYRRLGKNNGKQG